MMAFLNKQARTKKLLASIPAVALLVLVVVVVVVVVVVSNQFNDRSHEMPEGFKVVSLFFPIYSKLQFRRKPQEVIEPLGPVFLSVTIDFLSNAS
jgi:hypothetical protein